MCLSTLAAKPAALPPPPPPPLLPAPPFPSSPQAVMRSLFGWGGAPASPPSQAPPRPAAGGEEEAQQLLAAAQGSLDQLRVQSAQEACFPLLNEVGLLYWEDYNRRRCCCAGCHRPCDACAVGTAVLSIPCCPWRALLDRPIRLISSVCASTGFTQRAEAARSGAGQQLPGRHVDGVAEVRMASAGTACPAAPWRPRVRLRPAAAWACVRIRPSMCSLQPLRAC